MVFGAAPRAEAIGVTRYEDVSQMQHIACLSCPASGSSRDMCSPFQWLVERRDPVIARCWFLFLKWCYLVRLWYMQLILVWIVGIEQLRLLILLHVIDRDFELADPADLNRRSWICPFLLCIPTHAGIPPSLAITSGRRYQRVSAKLFHPIMPTLSPRSAISG